MGISVLELSKKSTLQFRISKEELALHREESVKFLVIDKVFFHAGDLTVPTLQELADGRRQEPLDMHRLQMIRTRIKTQIKKIQEKMMESKGDKEISSGHRKK